MKINKHNLWQVLEKYDTKEFSPLCDGLSKVIQGNSTSGDLLDIFFSAEKIQPVDRETIEREIGSDITTLFFCI